MKTKTMALFTGTLLFLGQLAVAHEVPFTDGQMAKIQSSADQQEIEAANLALDVSTNAKVKKLAEMLHADHTKSLNDLNELISKEKIAFEESEVEQRLAAEARSALQTLEKMTGVEFDRAYLDNVINCHNKVISLVTKAIPNVTNAALKTKLEKDLPILQSHLETAKIVRDSLNE